MADIIYTDGREQERQDAELAELQAKAAGVLAGSALGVGLASNIIDKNEKAREVLSRLPGANRYSKKHDIARAHAMANGAVPVDLTNVFANQSSQRSALSILSSIEEMSPMGVLKTLQISNLLEPFTKLTAEETPDIHLKPTDILANESFYRSMLLKNGVVLPDEAFQNGLVIKGGKLFLADSQGKAKGTNALLDNVKLLTTHVKMGERVSPNRVLQKFANIQGASLGNGGFHATQTAFIGSNSRLGLVRDWGRAYIRQGMEIGFKTMDNPLGGIEDILKATGIDNLPFANTPLYNKIKNNLNINLGTGGLYNLSTRRSIALMAENSTIKMGGIYLATKGADQLLHNITDESSIWHNGVLAGLANIYSSARVTSAKVLADPFQSYKENQEAAAQDSTSLLTLAGFPAAGAVAGASISYYRRLYDTGRIGMEEASSKAEMEASHGFGDALIKKLGFKNMAPYKSNALKGALIGGAIALPFLPGALIGESSEELKAKYAGEKQVENRANRWWLMGGERYEGAHIKNYQSSLIHRLKVDPELQAKFEGDRNKQLSEDPLYSPLRYLRNPYRKEIRTQDESPYPVWGMEVTTGSFLGRLFQGTVGELIKPTILSPQMKREMALGGQAVNGESVSAGKNEVVSKDSEVVLTDTEGGQGYALSTRKGLAESGKAPPAIKNPDGTYSVKTVERPRDAKLIDAGMMLTQENASVNEVSQPLKKAYSALGDFVGLKGYVANSALEAIGLDFETSKRQLARSGQGDSLASKIREQNLGDIGGLGEFQRRMVPTSAASKQDTVNPLQNKVAPSWLPKDSSKYYIDFSQGDYWSKVANASMRLPGGGYAALNPDVKGINPEDYPLVHKFKILSDVARGSEEQIAMRKQLLAKVSSGEIQGTDKDLFYQTLEQEKNKNVKKRFNEYLTSEEKSNLSLGGKVLNKIWETVAHHSEIPTEALTPLRPASKLIHQRSAIEDYNKTMLQGPDTGIWSNPYSHFVRVAWNRTIDAVTPGVQKPKEAIERDNVEEYFDKLAYIKARKNGNVNDALKTTVGRTNAGIIDKDAMHKFKAGLSSDQQAYVEAFAKETDSSKRKEILKMLPKNVSDGYMEIWNNLSIAEKAKANGQDVNRALKEEHIKRTKELEKVHGIKNSEKVSNNLEQEYNKSVEKRLQMADVEAEKYVSSRTGVPSKDWLGWDPRLTMNDIKLRTLTVGKADIFRFGFWEPDKSRNERIVALDKEHEVTNKLNEIKKVLRDNNEQKEFIRKQMLDKGIVATNVELTPASRNDVRVAVKQSEK